jgi:hypothetical protein
MIGIAVAGLIGLGLPAGAFLLFRWLGEKYIARLGL